MRREYENIEINGLHKDATLTMMQMKGNEEGEKILADKFSSFFMVSNICTLE
jgi:hypothetical protein